MAQEIGRNIVFPIYNADGTPFHDLVIRKATYDEVVMSLGRKIVGDVYYKSNTLDVAMTEYIEYNGVQYKLVNPPTVVKEGMVSDNGDAKGMTKYSFTFYHPEYELSNLPFTDIAVDQAEIPYKSQDKTFYWIGNLIDFIAKLNANLTGTQWIVRMTGNEESAAKALKLSDVLPFDQVFIADALKTAYDTWEIPYTVDKLSSDDAAVAQGKMFAIYFGKPSNEIYEDDNSLVPFVFKCGQGLGLKNDSRTPKNNKIVTRIVGHGSENNIPYGYPQIRWYGDDDASFTYGDHAGVYEDVTIGGVHFDKVVSYPIYEGIVNGEYVKLIKHPFTRKNLMPSVYAQTVFNNVSPYLARTGSTLIVNTNYDPDTELIDYYDAIDEQDFQYVNNIDPNAPSVEYHEFEDIKPKINPQTALVGVEAYNTQEEEDKRSAESISEADFLEYLGQEEHWCELSLLVEDQNALTMMAQAYNTGENASYEKNGGATNFKWTLTFTNGACIAQYRSSTPIAFDYYVVEEVSTSESESESVVVPAAWDDTMDANGEYRQSYFKATLPTFNFDLYACASITQEMKLYMRSGACQGCTFEVMVDWEDYKKNFYDEDGNFDPVIGEGHPRNGEKYPDSRTENITVIVKKDLDTFGVLMPNTFQMIAAGDTFAILGISLPESYITDAEQELDEAMKEYMLENNLYYFDYPLKFDEFFFAKHPFILEQMRMNTIVRFDYANEPTKVLYVKQMTIKWGVSPLPQYSITLTDDIEVVLNQIGRTTEDVSRLRVQMSEIQKYYGSGGEGGSGGRNEYLSRIMDDVAAGRITFQQGLDALGRVIFSDDIYSNGFVSGMDTTGRGWRIDRLGNAELESLRVRSFLEVIELLVNRLQAQEGDTLFTDNDQIEYVEEKQYNNDTYYKLTLKEKWEGYYTALNFEGNIIKGIINTLAANVGNVSDVSPSDCIETDGENKYFTSWMEVIDPSDVEDSVGQNQICVKLFSNSQTPARRNFPPCELMTIARFGNTRDANAEGISANDKAAIEKRQRLFSISTSDGRITKLRGVRAPILQESNYGTTLGIIPDFINNWSIRNRLIAGRDYLYAQGVIVGDFIKVDIHGDPLINYVDCGNWVNGGESGVTPTVGHGKYLCNEYNPTNLQYETHDVWHNGAYWRCKRSQPIVQGGQEIYQEPSESHPLDWEKKLSSGQAITFTQVVKYAKGNDGTTVPTSGWQTTIPTVEDGKYLWTWTRTTYSDGTVTDAYSVSRMGIDGKGIQSSTVYYSQKASNVAPESITDWSTTFPTTLIDGYWLYTKTHIVYSDSESTDSYSVSQIGVGAFYAGTQEYWALGDSSSVAPTGYPDKGTAWPQTYGNGESPSITGNWSTNKPVFSLATPYIWNFEISADSKGNKYVTQPVCVGNYSKGISSIVETYTISSHTLRDDMLADTAERTAYPWTDEVHDAAPTAAKPYQWNKTVTTYNDNSTDTYYHISAARGEDGTSAYVLDLDNESDDMLYKGDLSTYIGEKPTTTWYLYEGGTNISSRVTRDASHCTFNAVGCTASWLSTDTSDANAFRTLRIDSMTADTGYVNIYVTYNGNQYIAKFSLRRTSGIDKYEIVLDRNILTYNQTSASFTGANSFTVRIYKTEANTGNRINISSIPSGWTLWCNRVTEGGAIVGSNVTSDYSSSYTLTNADGSYQAYRIVLSSGSSWAARVVDSETVPIAKSTNGGTSSVVRLFKRADTKPQSVGITVNLYYKFENNKLYTDAACTTEATSGNLVGWSLDIPDGDNDLYMTAAVAYGVGTSASILSSAWATPVSYVLNGDDGVNTAIVMLYRRSSTALTSSDKPTGSLTYTFATGALSVPSGSSLNGWSQTMPATDNKKPCYVIQAMAISNDDTDSIAASEWSVPRKMVEDGVDGTSPIFIDVDNEMRSFACTSSGALVSAFDFYVNVNVWKGNSVQPLSNLTVSSSPSSGTNINATAYYSSKRIRFYASADAVIPESTVYTITATPSDTSIPSQTIKFTLAGVRAGSTGASAIVYELSPSTTDVVKRNDGTFYPPSMSCSVTKHEGATITPNTSDCTLERSTDGGATWTSYTRNATITFGTGSGQVDIGANGIKFRAKKSSTVVDVETIPLIYDGENGTDGQDMRPNLLDGSNFVINVDSWEHNDSSVNSDGVYGQKSMYTTTTTAMKDFKQVVLNGSTISKIKPSTWYTLSFWVKGGKSSSSSTQTPLCGSYIYPNVVDTTVNAYLDGVAATPTTDGHMYVTLTSVWTKHTYTFKTKSSFDNNAKNVLFRTFEYTNSYVSCPKLEEGTTASEWCLSENDKKGADGVLYYINSNVACVAIPSDETSTTVSATLQFRQRVGSAAATAYSCYTAAFWRNGTSYTRITSTSIYPSYSQKRSTATLSNASTNYNNSASSGAADAIVIRIYTTGSEPTSSTAYIAEFEIAILKNGDTGQKGNTGSIGRGYYYKGLWTDYSSSDTFTVTDAEAPFFALLKDGSTTLYDYWVWVGANGTYNIDNAHKPTNTGEIAASWELMVTDFKFLITEAMFTRFAKLGSGVFNEDWMYSQYSSDINTIWTGSYTRSETKYAQVGNNSFPVVAGRRYTVYITARSTNSSGQNLTLRIDYNLYGSQYYGGNDRIGFNDTLSKVHTITFYAGYTCNACVAAWGYGTITNIAVDSASNYTDMSPSFVNGEAISLITGSIDVLSENTSANTARVIPSAFYVCKGKTYKITFTVNRITGGTMYLKLCKADNTHTSISDDIASTASARTFYKNFTIVGTYDGLARIEMYKSSSSDTVILGSVNIEPIDPFIPQVAVDWRSGYAHFAGGAAQFKSDGSLILKNGVMAGFARRVPDIITSSDIGGRLIEMNNIYSNVVEHDSGSNIKLVYSNSGTELIPDLRKVGTWMVFNMSSSFPIHVVLPFYYPAEFVGTWKFDAAYAVAVGAVSQIGTGDDPSALVKSQTDNALVTAASYAGCSVEITNIGNSPIYVYGISGTTFEGSTAFQQPWTSFTVSNGCTVVVKCSDYGKAESSSSQSGSAARNAIRISWEIQSYRTQIDLDQSDFEDIE